MHLGKLGQGRTGARSPDMCVSVLLPSYRQSHEPFKAPDSYQKLTSVTCATDLDPGPAGPTDAPLTFVSRTRATPPIRSANLPNFFHCPPALASIGSTSPIAELVHPGSQSLGRGGCPGFILELENERQSDLILRHPDIQYATRTIFAAHSHLCEGISFF